MGSRYEDPYRSSVGFGRGPPGGGGGGGERWDSLRFTRESEDRSRGGPPPPPPMEWERERERERPPPSYGPRFEEPYSPRGRPVMDRFDGRYEDRFEDRFFREERHGPPPRRPERRYYDEDDFYLPREPPTRGAMVPYQSDRPPRPPQLLRRQSSLDTFDRRPMRHHHQYDDRPEFDDHHHHRHHHREPAVIPFPVPESRSPPRYSRARYADQDYDDIRIAEPEYFGDDEFRGYREREWTRRRSKRRSASSSSSSSSSGKESHRAREKKEKKYPRKGKTRMPSRLAHTKILIELGYPYKEEGDMIIIEKALGKENIDEVVTLSREYREKQKESEATSTIHIVKSPPVEEKKTEEVVERKITTVPIAEAPRSVREWDNLSVEKVEGSRSKSKRRSHSRHVSRSRRSPSPKETVIEKTIVRDSSPGRLRSHSHSHSHRHHRSSSAHAVEYVERRAVGNDNAGESNPIHTGPLALVVDRHPKPDREASIKEEIRALEAEQRAVRNERIEIHRPSRRREEEREIVKERPAEEEVIEIKKDKKEPDTKIIRAMMATLT